MTQTKIPVKTAPRSVDQILAANAVKNKGGRPKGSKNKATLAKEQGQTTIPIDTKPKDIAADLAALKLEAAEVTQPPPPAAPPPPAPAPDGQPAPAPPPPTTPQQPEPPKAWKLSGHIGLIVVDAFLSSGLALILNRFLGYDTTKEQLQLTEKEVRDLEPLADEVAGMIMANPVIVLGIALTGCYLGKIPAKPKKATAAD